MSRNLYNLLQIQILSPIFHDIQYWPKKVVSDILFSFIFKKSCIFESSFQEHNIVAKMKHVIDRGSFKAR